MSQDKGTGNKPRPEKEAERAPKKMTKPGGGGKPQAVDENSRYTSTGSGKPLGMKKDSQLTDCSSSEEERETQIPSVPRAARFNPDKGKQQSHANRHAKELGYKRDKDYFQGAVEFFNSDKGTLYYSELRERFYRYDVSSQKLAVCDQDGIIRTYMKTRTKWLNDKFIEERLIKI